MKLISVLSGNGFVMYNKELAHTVSVNGAIIFGQLCSSYESFGSKGMLTVKEEREYFFLTSETLEEETALSYKQQLKAIKELEQAGYIETKVMGVPSKKYFSITDKIVQDLLSEVNPSSDKREDLNVSTNPETVQQESEPSLSKKETLALPKGNGKPVQKGSTIKKKNKKEQDKDNKYNFNCNYKESPTTNEFEELLTNSCNEFYTQFSVGRYSKKQWNTLIRKFVNDTIESGRYLNVPVDKIRGYAYKSLEIICDNSDYKRSDEFAEYQEVMRELSNKEINKSKPNYGLHNGFEIDNDELPY
ncbi:hypothetical protein [Bacillus pseudomycoides]|uniref:hypothetical protein n=1 Tax=Bacillus pseudomycoides TaxID=64104 RepID=UPI000BEF6E66|nr:hypothetical protein [Bacillus pseudomycoides]PEJ37271.1 hypothetical protein CN677_09475 [Bacillus pseudomycoides]PHA98374.1 hypothetical protein COE78_01980 [Bacillus pseudomycoides]PHC78277.1 hypothetical protein COF38_07195 [Bacillus pseudomycoides]